MWTDECSEAYKKLNLALLSVPWMFKAEFNEISSELRHTNVINEIGRLGGLLGIKPTGLLRFTVHPRPLEGKVYISLHSVVPKQKKSIIVDLRRVNVPIDL